MQTIGYKLYPSDFSPVDTTTTTDASKFTYRDLDHVSMWSLWNLVDNVTHKILIRTQIIGKKLSQQVSQHFLLTVSPSIAADGISEKRVFSILSVLVLRSTSLRNCFVAIDLLRVKLSYHSTKHKNHSDFEAEQWKFHSPLKIETCNSDRRIINGGPWPAPYQNGPVTWAETPAGHYPTTTTTTTNAPRLGIRSCIV